jgi:hypothetical protein
MTEEEKTQIEKQMMATLHLINKLHVVIDQITVLYFNHKPVDDGILRDWGCRSARILEDLGDMANDMDIVEPEDEWINPIITKARERYLA